MYGQVEWLNINEEIEKYNKKHTYETLCFVFDSGAMLLCIENKNTKLIKKKVSELWGIHTHLHANRLNLLFVLFIGY